MVIQFPATGNGSRERRHFDTGTIGQSFDQQIDVRRIDLRLVSLNIDDDLSIAARAANDFRHAVGTAGVLARHFHAAAESFDSPGNLVTVGGDNHPVERFGPAGLLPGVLQQGLPRVGQQQLARQA
jgi:hypothetical protein